MHMDARVEIAVSAETLRQLLALYRAGYLPFEPESGPCNGNFESGHVILPFSRRGRR